MVRLTLTFRENVAMLRASRDEALTDALTGLGNRRALARELDARLPRRRRRRRRSCSCCSTSTASSTTTTPSATPPATRCSCASARNLRGLPRAAAADAFRMGGDEFCVLFEPRRRGRRRRSSRGAAHGAVRARRGLLRSAAPTARSCCPREAHGRRRGAADRRPAHVRAEERRPHVGRRARARTCCCARWPSATPSSAATSSGVAELAEATARRLGLTDDEVERVRHAAELHDVGKVAIPDAILAKPGPLDDARVGVHPPPHADRRAHRRRRAGARAASRALVRSSHERWDGTGYPDAPRRRGDPARRAHRRRRRRLRRDDLRAPLPRRGRAARRRSASCAAARARSSTRSWSRRSAPPGRSVRATRRPTPAATSHPCRGSRAAA